MKRNCEKTHSSGDALNFVIASYKRGLVHSRFCRQRDCSFPKCQELKDSAWHLNECNITLSGGGIRKCPVCTKFVSVCAQHSVDCSKDQCPIPFCSQFKLKIRTENINNSSDLLHEERKKEIERRNDFTLQSNSSNQVPNELPPLIPISELQQQQTCSISTRTPNHSPAIEQQIVTQEQKENLSLKEEIKIDLGKKQRASKLTDLTNGSHKDKDSTRRPRYVAIQPKSSALPTPPFVFLPVNQTNAVLQTIQPVFKLVPAGFVVLNPGQAKNKTQHL